VRGRAAVDLAAGRVILCAEFRIADVPDPDDRRLAGLAGANDDLLELLRLDQHALAGDREIQLRPLRRGRLANLADAEGLVLAADRVGQFRHRDPHLRESIRLQPDPHRDVGDREHHRKISAGQALYCVEDIKVDVVIQVDRADAVVGRVETHDHHEGLGFLLGGDALIDDHLRQFRHGLADAVLRIDLRDVRIRARFESDDQRHIAGR
jgi:hypothetical protein